MQTLCGAVLCHHVDDRSNLLGTYSSMNEAAKALNDNATDISEVTRGLKMCTRKGNIFVRGDKIFDGGLLRSSLSENKVRQLDDSFTLSGSANVNAAPQIQADEAFLNVRSMVISTALTNATATSTSPGREGGDMNTCNDGSSSSSSEKSGRGGDRNCNNVNGVVLPSEANNYLSLTSNIGEQNEAIEINDIEVNKDSETTHGENLFSGEAEKEMKTGRHLNVDQKDEDSGVEEGSGCGDGANINGILERRGQLFNNEEQSRFAAEVMARKKDLRAVGKAIGRSTGDCILYYYAYFKHGRRGEYKRLKRFMHNAQAWGIDNTDGDGNSYNEHVEAQEILERKKDDKGGETGEENDDEGDSSSSSIFSLNPPSASVIAENFSPRLGCRVLVKFDDGKWYGGRIAICGKSSLTIDYDDGERESSQ